MPSYFVSKFPSRSEDRVRGFQTRGNNRVILPAQTTHKTMNTKTQERCVEIEGWYPRLVNMWPTIYTLLTQIRIGYSYICRFTYSFVCIINLLFLMTILWYEYTAVYFSYFTYWWTWGLFPFLAIVKKAALRKRPFVDICLHFF